VINLLVITLTLNK